MDVDWQIDLENRIPPALLAQLTAELKKAFAGSRKILVRQQFSGFKVQVADKIVLGVEVSTQGVYRSYIVKIGLRSEVENDYEGWQRCVSGKDFASRLFVTVEKRDLGHDRTAVLYENAYRYYEARPGEPGVHALENAVNWAVKDDKPDPVSVERVIRQVYSELGRWFYRGAWIDPNKACMFYNNRLKRCDPSKDILARWNTETERQELRTDLIWLLCGQDAPSTEQDAYYLDPYDYVHWALEAKQIPETMLGRSHGDLHGRNILVGVQRGEAEYPSVFDYGEMDVENVLVWDFVKMEMELKVRLLPELYDNEEAYAKALSLLPKTVQPLVPNLETLPSAQLDDRTKRIARLAFTFACENHLAALTDNIEGKDYETKEPPGGRSITGVKMLDRALAMFTRIRQEAALYLGQLQNRSSKRNWRDEYLFALAVYGLYGAKFDYDRQGLEVALIAAGVAVSRMERARRQVKRELAEMHQGAEPWRTPDSLSFSSYRPLLAYAHHLWKERSTGRALEVSRCAAECFPLAVPVLQTHALILTAEGFYNESILVVEPFQGLCRVFHDRETLSRIGATYKKMGDLDIQRNPCSVQDLPKRVAFQRYQTSYERYREAYAIDHHYYPGINAAMLATLIGKRQQAEEITRAVQACCRNIDLGAVDAEKRFWLFATEGEACLLLGDKGAALRFYRSALETLSPLSKGMVQSAFDQVCRHFWMKPNAVRPICDLFHKYAPDLQPGPLSDCT